ncbi:MAG: hypothetical protein HYV32_03300 [Candidatus Kerfeldbacteria bacterium]|nr:hypothetical protein [Candidatus Kerfeldbacteria bacterium]
MRTGVFSKVLSSTMVFSFVFMSVAPQLVRAQELSAEGTNESPAVVEPVDSTALETEPEITVLEQADTDHSMNVSKTEVKEALESLSGVLETSEDIVVDRDVDSAIITSTEDGTIVDIPKNPEDGVTLGTEDGTTIEIGLPNADEAKNAKRIADGVVAYPAKDGSANAVQADVEGGVRMLTVIDNPEAPTEYAYTVTVPSGGHIELTEDGGAVVVDENNEPIAMVATPWAKDAAGNDVETYFTTDGQTLTQHILHNVEGISYPVTADPFWIPAAVTTAIVLAARACVNTVIGGIGIDAVRWAIQRNDWYWKEKLEQAAWGCAISGATMGVFKVLPNSAQYWIKQQIVNTTKFLLKWWV